MNDNRLGITKSKKNIIYKIIGVFGVLCIILGIFMYFNSSESNKTYKVSFMYGDEEYIAPVLVLKNDKVSKPANPVKEGYTFDGWYYNGTKFDFSVGVTSDIVLEAKWIKKNSGGVSDFVLQAKKNSYTVTAEQYIRSLSLKVNSGSSLTLTDPSRAYLIKVSNIVADNGCVKLESGGTSPFGDWIASYVLVIFNGNGWEYYFTALDDGGYGMDPWHQRTLNNKEIPFANYTSSGVATIYNANVVGASDYSTNGFNNSKKITSKSLPEIAKEAEKVMVNEENISYIKLETKLMVTNSDEKYTATNLTELVVITDQSGNFNCQYNPYQ